MPYPKCKVYSDGSHYIAIPYIPQKPRYKKRKKLPPPQPEMEVVEDEGPTPFDKFEQMSLFDESSADDAASEQKEELQALSVSSEEKVVNEDMKFPSRREIFERLYSEHINEPKKRRKKLLIEGMLPYCADYEEAKMYVENNLRRKRNNLIARRVRMTRKANLQSIQADFNFFVTLTYSDELHTEESFKAGVESCLRNLCNRKGWKYVGVWERSPKKRRLHFHGIFYIPEGTMPGKLFEKNDYSFRAHKRQVTVQNTYFNKRFGRSDFAALPETELRFALAYLMKYLGKTNEKIVYSRGTEQYFVSDVMEEDVVCRIGVGERKLLLYDDFVCWDEGEYLGKVNRELIRRLCAKQLLNRLKTKKVASYRQNA